MSIRDHLDIFDEGADACLSGIELRDCPYCALTQPEFYDAWTTGHMAETQRLKILSKRECEYEK